MQKAKPAMQMGVITEWFIKYQTEEDIARSIRMLSEKAHADTHMDQKLKEWNRNF